MVRIKKGKQVLSVPYGAFKSIYSREGWNLVGEETVTEIIDEVDGYEEIDEINEEETDEEEIDDEETEAEGVEESEADAEDEEMPDEIKKLLKTNPSKMQKEQVSAFCNYFGIDVKGKTKPEILVLMQELIDNYK